MRRRLWFDNVCLSDFGLWISGDYTEALAEHLGEGVHIPGRSGDYWIDEGAWQNLTLEYPAFLLGATERELQGRLRSLRQVLGGTPGYVRIEDDYHPDEYRMGRYVSGLAEQTSYYSRASEFRLVFDCKPQRYLRSTRPLVLADQETEGAPGDLVTDNPAVLRNPTGREARPMLRLFYDDRTAPMSVTFGDCLIVCQPCGHYCIGIDMEARTCYYNGENLSRYVSITKGGAVAMDYPAIGDRVEITRGTNCKAVQVYPRWWWL